MRAAWTGNANSSASPPRAHPKAKRGRPPGSFTQHRRFDALRTLLLHHPKGLTLYEIADRLAVSPRSARRYLRELARLTELEPVPGAGGRARRWRIAPSDIPRKISVRRTQAYALLAARTLFTPIRGSALYEEIDLAAQHLVGVARQPGRGPNAGVADAHLEDRFLYLPFAPKDYSLLSDVVDDLYQAVADLRPLSMRYPNPQDGKLERVQVHPYALFVYKDALLFVGLDVGRQAVRTFLVDQTRDTVCSTGRRFELPADFRATQYWQGQFGVAPPGKPIDVVIDFDPEVAEHVRTRSVHPSQRVDATRGGGVRLRMKLGEMDEVATWVLGFGAKAHVVAPKELAERVRREHWAAYARYDSSRRKTAAAPKPAKTKAARRPATPRRKPRPTAAAPTTARRAR